MVDLLTISSLRTAGSRLSFALDGGPAEEVWFETQREFAPWLVTDRYDAAVVSVLPYAMKNGKAIKVHGAVTGTLLHALRTGVIPILLEQMPSLRPVEIAADVLPAPGHGSAVLTGLSCGVDSLSTFAAFRDHEAPELRITHAGFFNVGSNWLADRAEEDVFAARRSRVRQAAAELGLPLVEVITNVSKPFWAGRYFQQHHTLWNCAVAMSLGKGIGTYLYSSAMPYREISIRATDDSAYADPILLPLLAASGVTCISSNAHMQRVEKTEMIADWPFAQRWLNVCEVPNPDGGNCSSCTKCCRTLLTLEILGKLQAFANIFDLDEYEAVKADYAAYTVHTGTKLFSREIVELAQRRDSTVITNWHRFDACKKTAIACVIPHVPSWLKWRLRRLQGIWA